VLEPPDIRRAFVNDSERQARIVELFDLDKQLRGLLDAAKHLAAEGAIPDGLRRAIERQPAARGDSPENRLRRWTNLFEDDMDSVHDVRSRIVHGILVSDADIRGAIWLGRHILGLLVGDRRVA
jgi:hypothetical protein